MINVTTKMRPLTLDQRRALADYMEHKRGIRTTAKILNCDPSGVRSIVTTIMRQAAKHQELDAATLIETYGNASKTI